MGIFFEFFVSLLSGLGPIWVPIGVAVLAVLIGLVSMHLLIPIKEVEQPPGKIFKSLFRVCNIISLLGLLAWPFGVVFSFGLMISCCGYLTERYIMAFSIWTYPLIYLIGFIGSVILKNKNYYKASIVFSSLPLINVFLIVIINIYLTEVIS